MIKHLKRIRKSGWEKPAPNYTEAIGIAVTLQQRVFDPGSHECMSLWEQIHHVISDREALRKKVEKMKKGRK